MLLCQQNNRKKQYDGFMEVIFIIIFFTLDIWSQTNPNQGIEAQNHKKQIHFFQRKKLQQNLGKWTGLDLEKQRNPIF